MAMPKTVKDILRRLPMSLAGSLDVLSHKTPADFAYLAQHEIDLYDEGEDSDIRNARDRETCVRFMRFCRSLIEKGNKS